MPILTNAMAFGLFPLLGAPFEGFFASEVPYTKPDPISLILGLSGFVSCVAYMIIDKQQIAWCSRVMWWRNFLKGILTGHGVPLWDQRQIDTVIYETFPLSSLLARFRSNYIIEFVLNYLKFTWVALQSVSALISIWFMNVWRGVNTKTQNSSFFSWPSSCEEGVCCSNSQDWECSYDLFLVINIAENGRILDLLSNNLVQLLLV